MGFEVHDSYVKHWWELEKQDIYPAPGHSWPRFFRNQESLSDIRISKDLETFFAAGYEVKGLGRGHMKRLKEEGGEPVSEGKQNADVCSAEVTMKFKLPGF